MGTSALALSYILATPEMTAHALAKTQNPEQGCGQTAGDVVCFTAPSLLHSAGAGAIAFPFGGPVASAATCGATFFGHELFSSCLYWLKGNNAKVQTYAPEATLPTQPPAMAMEDESRPASVTAHLSQVQPFEMPRQLDVVSVSSGASRGEFDLQAPMAGQRPPLPEEKEEVTEFKLPHLLSTHQLGDAGDRTPRPFHTRRHHRSIDTAPPSPGSPPVEQTSEYSFDMVGIPGAASHSPTAGIVPTMMHPRMAALKAEEGRFGWLEEKPMTPVPLWRGSSVPFYPPAPPPLPLTHNNHLLREASLSQEGSPRSVHSDRQDASPGYAIPPLAAIPPYQLELEIETQRARRLPSGFTTQRGEHLSPSFERVTQEPVFTAATYSDSTQTSQHASPASSPEPTSPLAVPTTTGRWSRRRESVVAENQYVTHHHAWEPPSPSGSVRSLEAVGSPSSFIERSGSSFAERVVTSPSLRTTQASQRATSAQTIPPERWADQVEPLAIRRSRSAPMANTASL